MYIPVDWTPTCKEGEKLRPKEARNDDMAIGPDDLWQEGQKQKGEKLQTAEAMTVAGIKNQEMPTSKQVRKSRGDNEKAVPACQHCPYTLRL